MDIEKVRAFADDEDKIIVSFVDHRYLPIALNWVKFLDRLDVQNYVLVAMDTLAFEAFRARNINAALLLPEDSAGNTHEFAWFSRTLMVKSLLEHGLHVILSDVDAVWLKNPIPTFIFTS